MQNPVIKQDKSKEPYVRAAKATFRGLLNEGMADTCARHIDEVKQCSEYFASLPPKDHRKEHREPRESDCYYQKQNVQLCYDYHAKKIREECQPQMNQLYNLIKARHKVQFSTGGGKGAGGEGEKEREGGVSVEEVKAAYHKLFYCVRKPGTGLAGKKMKYPLDYGIGAAPLDDPFSTKI